MNFDYSEADEYEADFAAGGELELEELEAWDGDDAEVAALGARVEAARRWH